MNIQMIKAALEYKFETVAKAGKFKGQVVQRKISMKETSSEINKAHWSAMKEMNIEDAVTYAQSIKDTYSFEKDLKQSVVNQFRNEVEFNSISEYETAKQTRNLGDKFSGKNGWSAYEYLTVPDFFNI